MYKVFHHSGKILIGKKEEFINNQIDCSIFLSASKFCKVLINNELYQNFCLEIDQDIEIETIFESLFTIRVAAGGWVFNANKELLMILRNGLWDIPKGHIDKGETLEQCALREVMEETGIASLNLPEYLGISRHIFMDKQKWILKITHWFAMQSDFEEELIPQTDEGIEKAEWVSKEDVLSKLKKGWPSLLDFYLEFVV